MNTTNYKRRSAVKTYSDIDALVKNNLDKEIKYSKDRVKLVEDMLNDNSWIIDLISSEEYRGSQVKSKKDPLSTNSVPDKIFEKIADYILFPKFEDVADEKEYRRLRQEYSDLKNDLREINNTKEKKKDKERSIQLANIRSKIKKVKKHLDSNFNKDYLTVSAKKRNEAKEELYDSIDELDSLIFSNSHNQKSLNREVAREFDVDLNMDYWINMGFSVESALFRQDIIDSYKDDIDKMRINLGYNISDANIRNEFRKKIVNILNNSPVEYKHNGNIYKIDGINQFRILRKMYADLVKNYQKAKESLAKIIKFKSITPSSTVFDYNSDTYYVDDNGSIHHVSKNHILFSDIETYAGLIKNYANLKFEFKDRFNSDMWAILYDFENILFNSSLSVEEKFVVNMILNDYSQREILLEYEKEFGKTMSGYSVSNWINRVIPNKLLNTYLDSVDEWLYTYKIKGKYKKCSKCGEVKLISNDRYFGKDARSRDGFQSMCKKCDNYRKKAK